MTASGPRLQPSLFELSKPGRRQDKVPHPPADALDRIPGEHRRELPAALPEVGEPETVRHFVNLSQLNHAVDTGFYPLGSCTMKWNAKVNEWAARLPGFAQLHPLAPDAVAQGELTGILMVRAYHETGGDRSRTDVLVPDSAHGTNPATATMAGLRTISIKAAPDGGLDLDGFRAALGPKTAAVMITNPSTLGLFESRIGELLQAVHEVGALAYMDGANLNAILGRFKPGEAGFDVMHINTHKTFSTPHGGGGPGAGPVAVGTKLEPFLPAPRVVREPDGAFRLERVGERPTSIGRIRSFVGSTGVLVRAYAYLRTHGGSGLAEITDDAVLAANYLKDRLADSGVFDIPFPGVCKHEFIASASSIKKRTGVRTLDIAKRLLDHGFHAPTVDFPLTVDEAMLIEPTETESIETLDAFADALIQIAAEAATEPETLASAPHTAAVKRLDEAAAARNPNLRWRPAPAELTPCPE